MKGVREEHIPTALSRFNSDHMDQWPRCKDSKGKPHVPVAFDEHDILRYGRKDQIV